MALPTIVVLLVFSLYPFFYLLALSISDSTLAKPFQGFKGLMHYQQALIDETFQTSLINTVVYAFSATLLEVVIGLLLALFFYQSVKSGRYLRTLALFPFIAPPVSVAMIWRLIYDPNAGLINFYLKEMHLSQDPIAFMGTASLAMPSMIAIDVWQWTPFAFLLSLAALQSLPSSPYEAALADGANGFQIFRYITLPMIAPALIVIALIRLLGAFKIFDVIYLLTFGGPGSSTQVLSFYIYRVAFNQFKTGYAAALTVLMLVVLTVIVTLLVRLRDDVRQRYE